MIVIDASSLAKYILREENWAVIERYLRESDLCSITLALAEVSNAIWKHHVLYRSISHEEAEIMFKTLEMIKEDVVIFEPFENYLSDAVKIAVEKSVPIYDALYLAQAKKYGSLLTSDEKQLEVAKKIGIDAEYVE